MQAPDLALQAGRLFQKEQTGFVHYCHQSKTDDHDTIPLLENACFALALFRSRLADSVLEGKSIIERLLPFEQKGNFPLYLHDFPETHDPYYGLKLLPIFFWILNDFSHVIGDLKGKLEGCLERILKGAKCLDLPSWAKFRMEAMDGKIGVFPNTQWEWAEALISLQIAEKKGANVAAALKAAAKNWHPKLKIYAGPVFQRPQMESTPAPSLYDLFMSEWQKKIPKRLETLSIVHLRGSLIRPQKIEFEPKSVPYVYFDEEAECPYFIGWKDHSFVLSKRHLHVEKNGDELVLTIPEEDEVAVNFYLDLHPDHDIRINGLKATAFQQGDALEIRSNLLNLHLSFETDDGIYFGHLLRGNRPSQHGGKQSAFDWKITIRTVRLGKSPMRVRVIPEPIEPENPQPLPSHASHYLHTR